MRWPDPGRWTATATRIAGRGMVAAIAVVVLLALPVLVLAASPEPTAVAAGDPRSSGQGPGLVGDPLAAILVVVAIATLAIAATLLYVRATGGPSATRPPR